MFCTVGAQGRMLSYNIVGAWAQGQGRAISLYSRGTVGAGQ